MEQESIVIYFVCDELLKAIQVYDDPQSKMSNAEVMTFTIIAAKWFYSNHRQARAVCRSFKYFPNLLSTSRLNRRIHRIPWIAWSAVFQFLAILFKDRNTTKEYAIDSCPIPCCQKVRIDRRKLFLGKNYVGYAASKKKYFCGLRIHMVVTASGEPVEFVLRPASENDVSVAWGMNLDIEEGAKLYADGAYTSFALEDILLDDECITLLPKRGKAHKRRRHSDELQKMISSRRQIVETAFSCITDMMPRNLRFRTERAFLIKIWALVIAYSFSRSELTHS